ncbi:uncharacterized protein PpBr36_11072 [Pyricularia pennisetigena]|uniref:uncharacterized protein n=1 Tax=Pyricularia pennisetigena TaxID=1578925 RepID=UPI001153CE31|nr:uncharacterized protein PpBr36_11072 [Pyricularia pennisetigena]TLS20620.1 hypothetical protein PpBr36_11072 [Pyricularia pennisetigena]
MVYAALARNPPDIYVRFIKWITNQRFEVTGLLNESLIIHAAHYGLYYDHFYLVRSMLSRGIRPPAVTFSDTLALFKVVKGLSAFVAKHVPWTNHEPYDAASDAGALKAVVKFAFQDEAEALLTFETSCEDYMKRTSINMYKPPPMVPYPKEDSADDVNSVSSAFSREKEEVAESVDSHL